VIRLAWTIATLAALCAIGNTIKDAIGSPLVPEGAAWVIAVVIACQAWSMHWHACEIDAVKHDYKALVRLVCGDLLTGLSDHMQERDRAGLMRLLGMEDPAQEERTGKLPRKHNTG
jgi:hypothetical protein